METGKKLVLIDGHAMLYRAYFAFPKTLTRRDGQLINAVYGFTRILLTVIEEMKPEYLAVSFDVGRTFRHDQFPEYKAHREKMPDELKSQEPLTYQVVESMNIPVFTMQGFEADDVIGTLAAQASGQNPKSKIQNPINTVIVTGDKDTLQLVLDPGVKVYMPGRANKGPMLYDEAAVIRDLGITAKQVPDYKGLAGDQSDNIPGVRGIGKVTAAKLLQQYGTIENIYENIESIKGAVGEKLRIGKENAFESKKLATIVTDVPLNLDLEAALVRQYDKDKVVKTFEALEFRSLLSKLPDDGFEASVQEALFFNMKVALVHDYLNEFGGAERVLEALSEMYPDAPIYTAFYKKGSAAYERFKNRKIIASWAQKVPGFVDKLHSPLRFLAPLIWESFNLDDYDLVISSASWYITKGIITRPETVHICYCHTPPRYLYGYETSINWQRYWPVRLYAKVVNKYLTRYDYLAAQRVDWFVANSKNVQGRIKKYYGRESQVIYPPVKLDLRSQILDSRSRNYYLVISRLVGGKGIEMAVRAANQLKVPLKIVGAGNGYSREEKRLKRLAGPTVEFLGFVADEKLTELYAGAKAFLALARDEDFGITPVEAMMAGTPVIAFNGGGYKETVIDGKTGILFNDYSVEGLVNAITSMQYGVYSMRQIQEHAQKFSKERFMREMRELVEKKYHAI